MNNLVRCLLAVLAAALVVTGTASATVVSSAANGSWSDSTTWQGGVPPGPADTVLIRSVDSVTINTSATIAGLIVDGWFATSKEVLVALTINGDLTVNSLATFKVQTAVPTPFTGPHTLTISGNITNSGTVFDLRSGSAGSTLGVINLIFVGSSNSTITMISPYTTTNGDFNAITINKSGSARVVLGSDVFINGGSSAGPSSMTSILTFVNGIVETGPYTLIHQTGTAANVVGASSASYVLGAMGRGMANSGGSSKDFPVGDESGFRPFSLRSTTAGVSTGHHAIVRLIDGNANTGSSTLVGGIDRVSAVRYYKIKYISGAGAPQMGFDRFYPTYGTDDGVREGNTGLRVALSTDTRATWTKFEQTRYPHTTTLATPPTQIRPDSLNPPLVLNSAVDSIYVALADTTGGANPLQRSLPIVASAGPNGTISPSGVVTVVIGENETFTITPAPLYEVDSLIVDGAPVPAATSYTFTNVTAPHTVRAVFRLSSSAAINVDLAPGWNLIANPVANPVPGDSVRQLYPTSSNAYAFEFSAAGGYTQRFIMQNGTGYWGKFPAAVTQTITGVPLLLDTVAVAPGWNIIGGISCAVDTAAILSDPPDLRVSSWFGYTAGYAPVTQILPGQGYWVKTSAAGIFIFACPQATIRRDEGVRSGRTE
jgi:hypothetical protein